MKHEKCTILINTCDIYSDVWPLFFASIKYQWPTCNYPIVINTEKKNYENAEGIRVINYHGRSGKDNWGKRYKEALKQITTPYVIPLLEDFVLSDKFTGESLISNCIDWLDKDHDIGVFYLHKHPNVIQRSTEFPGFGLMPKECDYKLTTAPGIWRKEYLEKCIKGFETPWEWEMFVSQSAWKFPEKEFALLESENEVFKFPYGGVIRRGLWNTEAVELAEKYDVKIDFSKRGLMDTDDPYRMKGVYSVRRGFPRDILKARFWTAFRKRSIEKIREAICKR